MVVGWLLIAAAIAAVVVGVIVERNDAHARAAAPRVGDVWTIRTSRWHITDQGALEYGRMIVKAVDADGPTLAACSYTSDRESTIEDHCSTYPIDVGRVPTSDVARLIDDGAITSVWRGGDPKKPYMIAMGTFLAVAFVFGLFTRSAARRTLDGTIVSLGVLSR